MGGGQDCSRWCLMAGFKFPRRPRMLCTPSKFSGSPFWVVMPCFCVMFGLDETQYMGTAVSNGPTIWALLTITCMWSSGRMITVRGNLHHWHFVHYRFLWLNSGLRGEKPPSLHQRDKRCGCEVLGMILLFNGKGSTWVDRSRDMSVHVSTCTIEDFNALTPVVWKFWC